MARVLIAVALALAAFGAQASVYRCEVDGKKVFQNEPCPGGKLQDGYHGDRWVDPAESPRVQSGESGAPEILQFSGDPENQLSQAAARLSVINIKARDCDWGLKVKKDLLECFPLLRETVSGGPFSQAIDKITSLLETNPELASTPHTAVMLKRALSDGQNIRDTNNLVSAWVK